MSAEHNKLTLGGVACCLVALLAPAIFLLIGWGFQWAWNFVAAGALGAPALTYWQSAAAIVLLSIIGNLFRSSGGSK